LARHISSRNSRTNFLRGFGLRHAIVRLIRISGRLSNLLRVFYGVLLLERRFRRVRSVQYLRKFIQDHGRRRVRSKFRFTEYSETGVEILLHLSLEFTASFLSLRPMRRVHLEAKFALRIRRMLHWLSQSSILLILRRLRQHFMPIRHLVALELCLGRTGRFQFLHVVLHRPSSIRVDISSSQLVAILHERYHDVVDHHGDHVDQYARIANLFHSTRAIAMRIYAKYSNLRSWRGVEYSRRHRHALDDRLDVPVFQFTASGRRTSISGSQRFTRTRQRYVKYIIPFSIQFLQL